VAEGENETAIQRLNDEIAGELARTSRDDDLRRDRRRARRRRPVVAERHHLTEPRR
jgi:hypothetical protein